MGVGSFAEFYGWGPRGHARAVLYYREFPLTIANSNSHVFEILRGSLTVKVVPTAGWLETSMLPPWASTMALQMARPKPE